MKRQIHRGWSVAVLASLSIGVTACGSSGSSTSHNGAPTASGAAGAVSGTVSVGSEYLPAVIAPLVKGFEQAYPKTKVKIIYGTPDGYPQLIQTELQAGSAPDVVMADGGTGFQTPLLKLAKAGRLVDLSNQSWASGVSPLAKPLVQLHGKTYAYPPDQAPSFILYNPDIFKRDGVAVPTTFSSLLSACKTLSTKGVTPIGMAANGTAVPGALVLLMSSNFVYAGDPTWNTQRAAGKVTFAGSPAWHQTLQSIQDMKNANCYPSDAVTLQLPQMIGSFATGKTAMLAVPSAALGYITAAKPSFTPTAIAFPGASVSQTRVPAASSTNMAVNAQAPNKAAAVAFVKWLAEPAQQATWEKALFSISPSHVKTGQLPSYMSALDPFFKNGKVLTYPNALWPNPGVFNALAQGAEAIFAGRGHTQQTLAQADTAWSQ